MKQRIALLLFVLLLPALAFAQSPAPTPAAARVREAFTPAPSVPAGAPMMEEPQDPYQRPPEQPQPPRPPDLGKWWKNSDVVRELQLTDAQITQIEQTFLEHRLKLIDLKAEVERQETRLQPLIEADRPDEAKVSSQIDLLLAARGKLEKENAMMMLAIRRVLSVEQWKKLDSLQQMRSRFKEPYPPEQPGPGMRRPAPSPRPPGMDDD